MSGFGDAPIRAEGMRVKFDESQDDYEITAPAVETTWLEFPLPEILEEECWAMIKEWLKEKARTNPALKEWDCSWLDN